MRKIELFAPLPLSLAALLIPATAWACGPTGEDLWILGVIAAFFLAMPYALFTSIVAASQAKKWFQTFRRFRGWVGATIGAYAIGVVGSLAGFGAAWAVESLISSSKDGLQIALIFSTPLVFQVAYMMWLHARRVRD